MGQGKQEDMQHDAECRLASCTEGKGRERKGKALIRVEVGPALMTLEDGN